MLRSIVMPFRIYGKEMRITERNYFPLFFYYRTELISVDFFRYGFRWGRECTGMTYVMVSVEAIRCGNVYGKIRYGSSIRYDIR